MGNMRNHKLSGCQSVRDPENHIPAKMSIVRWWSGFRELSRYFVQKAGETRKPGEEAAGRPAQNEGKLKTGSVSNVCCDRITRRRGVSNRTAPDLVVSDEERNTLSRTRRQGPATKGGRREGGVVLKTKFSTRDDNHDTHTIGPLEEKFPRPRGGVVEQLHSSNHPHS